VHLSVRDNGMGMDEATLAHLFEPFFTTKPPGEGTGLGLAVVHGILRDHQAVVQVRSRPGEGTRFDLYFRAVAAPVDGGEPAAAPEDRRATPAVRGARILYVDDDELIADLMQRLLRRAGHEPRVFTSPIEALRAVRSGEVDYELAILDHSMPGMNGVELVRALRAHQPGAAMAITSGYLSTELRREAAAAGITELIDKPNTGEDLLAAIDRLVQRLRQPCTPG
jgi:CheY-like chemotaxis protein